MITHIGSIKMNGPQKPCGSKVVTGILGLKIILDQLIVGGFHLNFMRTQNAQQRATLNGKLLIIQHQNGLSYLKFIYIA